MQVFPFQQDFQSGNMLSTEEGGPSQNCLPDLWGQERLRDKAWKIQTRL